MFILIPLLSSSIFFFFNDTATTEIYTLSLHDALPISYVLSPDSSLHYRDSGMAGDELSRTVVREAARHLTDRKSTRLNSSHSQISYAVFCLKKKKKKNK